MYLYRVIEKERFLNGKIDNEKSETGIVNTFEYDDEEYIHFFVMPEDAELYQEYVFSDKKKDSFITRWNIPYSLIKDNFGVGLYMYYSNYNDPLLEVRINKKDLKRSMLEECSKVMHDDWNNQAIHNRYLKCLGLELSKVHMEHPLYINFDEDWFDQLEQHPRLNPKFNFLNYFPVEDLEIEGLSNDYTKKDDAYEEKPSLKTRIANIFTKKR